MFDKTRNEGIETFCNWFKERLEESKSASQWKIPNEYILNSKKVYLTVEEAEKIKNLILCLFNNKPERMSVFEAIDLLTERIEQVEGKNGIKL